MSRKKGSRNRKSGESELLAYIRKQEKDKKILICKIGIFTSTCCGLAMCVLALAMAVANLVIPRFLPLTFWFLVFICWCFKWMGDYEKELKELENSG